MNTLQERRHADLLAQIEAAAHRREKIIASLVRATNKIAAMARQVRRYEKIVPQPAAPPPGSRAGSGKRPAKQLMRPIKKLRLRRRR